MMQTGEHGSGSGSVVLKDIRGARFRANAAYELVQFGRLAPEQRDALRDLTNDPDLYGVLLPREGREGGIKSVCTRTALLYLTLLEPGPLPSYLPAALGEECNQDVAELVLDGVLEIESEGQFFSGSGAYHLIYPRMSEPAPPGALARLSRDALRYAQELDIDESGRLSARLYFYNRIPLSERWARRFPSEEAVASYLGFSSGRRLSRGDWRQITSSQPVQGWFQWECRALRASPSEVRHGYKLYVSPQPERLPDAFDAVLAALEEPAAHHFKVGNDAAGLLRPDKLVLYFSEFDALLGAAQRISERLAGCPAHGVPFTAPAVTEDGLLSWGYDPLPDKAAPSWRERESWRLWITNRLATALLAAKRAGAGGIEPWQFALERLRLEQIDTDTWTPAGAFVQPALAGS